MNSTKQNILEKSLVLFNKNGITNVPLRTIADDVGISVGNLQYHFKKREDIIEALYFQLVEKIDRIIVIKNDNLLKSFLDLSTITFSILYEYHFFLLDFVSITRKNKKIKKHYYELSKQREKQFMDIVDILIKEGIFREEILKNEYRNLFKRLEIISNFWFSSIIIQTDVLSKKSIQDYSLNIHQSVYPYLKEKGINQYSNLF